MVAKNMDIWAISGNNHIEAITYNNRVNTNEKQDSSFSNYKKEYSLHLYTSLNNIIIGKDEYK